MLNYLKQKINKHQTNKKLDEKKPIFYCFSLLISIVAIFFAIKYHNLWVLAFIIPALSIFVVVNYKQWKKILIVLIVLTVLIILYCFAANIYQTKDSSWVWYVRNEMVNYLTNVYPSDTSDFILMLLFGIKNNHALQNKINFLNIAQLFVVSGLHLQVFCKITKKTIKNKWANLTITLTILCFISYMTRFSVSSERVVLLYLLNLNHTFKDYDPFQKTSYNGLLLFFLNPLKATGYSFIMVHVAIFTINIITMYVSHKYLKWLLINVCVYLSLMPIVVNFNGVINLLSLLFSIVFSPLIIVLYFTILLIAWIPHFVVVNWLVEFTLNLINISFSYHQALKFKIPQYGQMIIYLCWYLFLVYGYQRKYYKAMFS